MPVFGIVKKKQNDTLVDYADYTLEIKADSFDKIGTYKVTYLVTDKNNSNSKSSLRRTVIVEDKEAPRITVNKTTQNYTQTILEGTKIDVPSCSAYDNYDGNLACKVINNYNGNTNPGTYQVEYTATDSSGNSNSFILTIIVKKKNKEIYLNKLNFDLDNNLEVLVLTIDNLLSFMKDNLVKKIIDIEEDFQDKESILENVNIFFEAYRNNLMNILKER